MQQHIQFYDSYGWFHLSEEILKRTEDHFRMSEYFQDIELRFPPPSELKALVNEELNNG